MFKWFTNMFVIDPKVGDAVAGIQDDFGHVAYDGVIVAVKEDSYIVYGDSMTETTATTNHHIVVPKDNIRLKKYER